MNRRLVALHGALLSSGAAGLVYESAWTRLLHRVFGVSDLAVATVLATFFLGLGIGNALAGRFVERIERPARAYALLEIAIGIYALVSLFVIPGLDVVYGSIGADAGFATLTLARFVLASCALLPPTILMGATLPVVALASRDAAWSRSVTAFYTTNTVGAMLGAGLAGFVLVPWLGTRATVVAGALASFLAGSVVLLVFGDARQNETDASTASHHEPDRVASVEAHPAGESAGRTPLGLAAWLTFLAGAAALGSEVVWTRALRIVVHGTTPAFAAMLVNYLAGIALGAWLARSLTRRYHPARVLGVSQLALVVLTAVSMALVPYAPRLVPILADQMDTVPHATWVIGLVSAALLLPLALVLGTGLPATWAMVERRADPGRGAAALLAANTVGGLVGSLATGFVSIPTVGTEATLLGLAAINAVVAAIALRHAAPEAEDPRGVLVRVGHTVAPLVVLTLVVSMRPSLEIRFLLSSATDPMRAVFQGPGESWDRDIVFLEEGRNTTVTVLRRGAGLGLYNDGRPESGFSPGQPGFGPELVMLGGMPGVLAGRREDAMIIGLGAGHTATMALATGFSRVRVVELEPAVVRAARLLHEARGRPFPLDDPRCELVVDDARNQLNLLEPGSLDAVVSQPSHPWLAGSSALYTREFFLEVDRALRPDGVFGLWVNLFRMDMPHLRSVVRTLIDVFPEVRAFVVESSSLVLMASRTPRPLDQAQDAVLRDADAQGPFFAPHGLGSVVDVLAHEEMAGETVREFAAGAPIIVDDRPALELDLASLPNGQTIGVADIDWVLRDQPWGEGAPDAVLLRRIERVEPRFRALDRMREAVARGGAEVRGRYAEARGDVTSALAAYDESDSASARARAASLRYAQGMLEEILANPRFDGNVPEEVWLAALASPSGPARVASAARARSQDQLAAYVAAVAEAGCEGRRPGAEELAQRFAEVARRESVCAWQSGRFDQAVRFEQLAWRARTARVAEDTVRGEAALAAGNGGLAMMCFERVLSIYPTTTRAAIGLARLHHRDGRADDARRVLDQAYRATEPLQEARERIVQAANSLGLEIASLMPVAEPGVSSASTVPATMSASD